jgi:hypothetical protein
VAPMSSPFSARLGACQAPSPPHGTRRQSGDVSRARDQQRRPRPTWWSVAPMSSPFLHPCHWYREMAQGRGIDASLSSAGWSWEPSSSSILHARRRLCRLQISGFCRREVLPPVVVLIRGNADEEVQRCLRQSSRLFLHSRLDPGKFLLSFYVLIFRLCELQDPRFLPLVGPPSCGRAQLWRCG